MIQCSSTTNDPHKLTAHKWNKENYLLHSWTTATSPVHSAIHKWIHHVLSCKFQLQKGYRMARGTNVRKYVFSKTKTSRIRHQKTNTITWAMDKKLVDSEVTSSSKMGHYGFCSDGNPTLSILWSYSHGQLKTYTQKQNWTNISSKPEVFPALLWIFSFFPSNPTKNHHQLIGFQVTLDSCSPPDVCRNIPSAPGSPKVFLFLDEICSIDKFSVVGSFNQKSTKKYLQNQRAENFFWVCYNHSIFELEFQQPIAAQQKARLFVHFQIFYVVLWSDLMIFQWKGAYQLASPMSNGATIGPPPRYPLHITSRVSPFVTSLSLRTKRIGFIEFTNINLKETSGWDDSLICISTKTIHIIYLQKVS